MSGRRKICVVTGSRAEYGLLHWLMKEISGDRDLELQLIATGMHLALEFGSTFHEIESEGFTIDAKVEMLVQDDTPVGTAESVAAGVAGMAKALSKLAPDVVVLLGDRFETLATAQAALFTNVPVAHIHGGESTEGAFDESIRHAITKMSHWHFVAAEPYRKRVVQMGESPNRVYNFGAPGLDHLERLEWLSRAELEKSLGVRLGRPLFLVTYHSATLSERKPLEALNELLITLDRFNEATVVITYSNADPGGRALIHRINEWVAFNSGRATATPSLGHQAYFSLMRESDVVIGNSSSALTEGPSLKKAAVDIGERQRGRLKASSVIDCGEERESIEAAIKKALSKDFVAALPSTRPLYGSGDVSRRIKDVLKAVELRTTKQFFDIEHAY